MPQLPSGHPNLDFMTSSLNNYYGKNFIIYFKIAIIII